MPWLLLVLVIMHSIFHQTKSILDMTTIQAFHCTIAERLGDALRKLSDVGMVEKVRKPQISIDNIRVQREEVLANRAEAGIFVAKRSNENGRFAVVIELLRYVSIDFLAVCKKRLTKWILP